MTPPRDTPAPPPVPWAWRAWIALGAWATAGGWILSSLSALHATGWAVWAVLGLLAGGVAWRRETLPAMRRWLRPGRLRRPAPAAFALLALAAGLGGALHGPVNWDTQWYRLPRVLHWLAEHRWHWIDTGEVRLNCIAPGLEWLWTPLVAWTRSDRLIFLPNLAAFLLLPGACFSLLRSLGTGARAARGWMWLLPAGWIYCLQAGSAANDAFATPTVAIAVTLALRAARHRSFADWAWSAVAIALVGNVKQSNLPLGLLWLLPAAAAWRVPWERPAATAAVLGLAAGVSFLPITAANLLHTGSWIGWPRAEQTWVPRNPAAALAVNGVMALHQSLAPPIVPWARAWNDRAARIQAGPVGRHLDGFENPGEMPFAISETWAGLGLLPAVLLAIGTWRARRSAPPMPRPADPAVVRWTRRLIWPLLVVFLVQMGTRQVARYLAAYLPFLLAPAAIAPGWADVVRRAWWRHGVVLVLLASTGLVLVSRQRPLLPPPALLPFLERTLPADGLWTRIGAKQREHLDRHRVFDRFLPAVAGDPEVGFAALTVGETVLWEPFGTRRVRHVRLDRPPPAGLRHVVVDDLAAVKSGRPDGFAWAQEVGGEVVDTVGLSVAEVRERRAGGRTPTLEELAFNRTTPGRPPPVNTAYLVRLPIKD